jgi:hypothetical protein
VSTWTKERLDVGGGLRDEDTERGMTGGGCWPFAEIGGGEGGCD